MIIKNGAIFIADAHYNSQREELMDILNDIKNGNIKATQLFLMGDIFDFLCDEADYFQDINYHLVDLIDEISHNLEVIYFEGNHDYNLEDTFLRLNLIPRKQQPIYTKIDNKTVALAHGDIFTPKLYNIYTAIIRNPYLLNFINLIDINNWITKKIEQKLKSKNLCRKKNNFEQLVQERIKNYKVDLIIEGHFHDGYLSEKYINVPAFVCGKQYMQYIDDEFKFFKV